MTNERVDDMRILSRRRICQHSINFSTKGSANLRPESRVSFHREKKFCDIDETESSSLKDQKEIMIAVESIENVDESKVKEILVKIDFNGNTLSQSFQTPITKSRADIGLTTTINAEDAKPQFLDKILSNPVLFTVLDCTASVPIPGGPVSPVSLEKEAKKKTSKASNTPYSDSKSLMTNITVLGMCNLDIGSLVIGEKRIKETLLVEPEKKLEPPEIVPWVKLPKLIVVVSTGDEPLIPKSVSKFNNIIGITIESIYNVPDYVTEGSFFDVIMLLPSIGDKTKRIKFPNGVATVTKDFIWRKKWLTLLHVDGRGARSKYSVSSNVCDVISTLPEKIKLEKEIKKSHKIIQWNMWKNCLMFKNDLNFFYGKITKNSFWPIEIFIPNRSKDQIQKEKSAKSDKKSKPVASENISNLDHFTAFLNLSPLLHPGVTKVRVAAQLFTYSQADLINKFGEEFVATQSQASVGTIKGKALSVRSKASVGELEENKDNSGMPVFNDEGSPTFIIVEIELLKPFNPKRDVELLEADLKANLCLKGKMNMKISNLALMQDSFSQTIKDTVSILTQEYKNFQSSLYNCYENQTEDIDTAFQNFLCKQESFYKVKTTLENQIIGLINEKYGALSQYKEKIPEIYVYLVNEMHKITNRCLIGQKDVLSFQVNNDNLQLFSEEAVEEGDYELAKQYLLMKISRDTSNPNYWLDYAAFCISLGRYEIAIEAVREALCLDFNHQIGLLMYALLMGMIRNGDAAEMAFEILLTKYPDFIEGWMALRFFYFIVNNFEGQLIASQEANKLEFSRQLTEKRDEKTIQNEENENCEPKYELTNPNSGRFDSTGEGKYGVSSFKNGRSLTEPLSWTTRFCPSDTLNIKTTILLQKLGFYEYALMALAQELNFYAMEDSLPPHYVYYTSVNYYLQGRYEETIPLLENFAKKYGKDCFLWSLLGHCYYKLNNHPQAISYYEYVMELYNRPDDIHLVYLRMGFYYIQANKFPCAKQVLKTACKYSPTPKLWKGVGIACLRMKEPEEAEIAFSEANYLDNKDPETWGYLALANAMLRRLDLFKQCYSEAVKRDLKNPDIIKEIKAQGLLNGIKIEE